MHGIFIFVVSRRNIEESYLLSFLLIFFSPLIFAVKFFFVVFFFFFQSQSNIDLVVIFISIFYICYAFGTIFLACELGQRISNAFEEIENVTGQCDWYLFPDEVKRMLPTILINVQHPVKLQCFGSFACCRNAFKMVSSKRKISA